MIRLGRVILFRPRLGARKWGVAVFSMVWGTAFFHVWNRDHKGNLILFERHHTDLLAVLS